MIRSALIALIAFLPAASITAITTPCQKNIFFIKFIKFHLGFLQLLLMFTLWIGPPMVDVFVKVLASIVCLVLIEKSFPNITIDWKAYTGTLFGCLGVHYFVFELLDMLFLA